MEDDWPAGLLMLMMVILILYIYIYTYIYVPNNWGSDLVWTWLL